MKLKPVEEKKTRKHELKKYATFSLMMCALVLCVYFGYCNYCLKADIKEKESELTERETELELLNEQKENWKERYYSELEESKKDSEELSFWRNNAVIATDGQYHEYGCEKLEDRLFVIFNLNAAINMGYKPCEECNPPDGGNGQFVVTPKE